MSQKITPFLWFDNNAEEAMKFYVSVFKNSKAGSLMRAGGKVVGVSFTLEGMDFKGLNGGPNHPFTDAISLFVNCEDQAEVDDLWNKLLARGGKEIQCGWLQDKYGLRWQIIPSALMKLMADPDPVKSGRVFQAMMKMVKIDIAELQKAYEQE